MLKNILTCITFWVGVDSFTSLDTASSSKVCNVLFMIVMFIVIVMNVLLSIVLMIYTKHNEGSVWLYFQALERWLEHTRCGRVFESFWDIWKCNKTLFPEFEIASQTNDCFMENVWSHFKIVTTFVIVYMYFLALWIVSEFDKCCYNHVTCYLSFPKHLFAHRSCVALQ